jgi:streptogramin lyase
MALLNFSSAPAKGASSTVTLDKSVLMALPEVVADDYYSDSTNIAHVLIIYGSVTGKQDKILSFDFTQSTPSTGLAFSAKARNAFEIKKIILKDFDGGEFIINRSVFIASTPTLSSLDLSLSGGSGSGFPPARNFAGTASVFATGFGANLAGGIDFDSSGNMYVADYTHSRLVKVTPAGSQTLLASAQFSDVTVDSANGFIYAATLWSGRVYKYGLDGTSYGIFATGLGHPAGITCNPATGDVYVVVNGYIKKITPAGTITNDAAIPTGDMGAWGLAFGPSGSIYFSGTSDNVIYKLSPEKNVSILAGSLSQAGNTDATGSAARFNNVYGLVVDAAESLYAVDYNNNKIRKITSTGVVTTTLTVASANMGAPGIDPSGYLYLKGDDITKVS